MSCFNLHLSPNSLFSTILTIHDSLYMFNAPTSSVPTVTLLLVLLSTSLLIRPDTWLEYSTLIGWNYHSRGWLSSVIGHWRDAPSGPLQDSTVSSLLSLSLSDSISFSLCQTLFLFLSLSLLLSLFLSLFLSLSLSLSDSLSASLSLTLMLTQLSHVLVLSLIVHRSNLPLSCIRGP